MGVASPDTTVMSDFLRKVASGSKSKAWRWSLPPFWVVPVAERWPETMTEPSSFFTATGMARFTLRVVELSSTAPGKMP